MRTGRIESTTRTITMATAPSRAQPARLHPRAATSRTHDPALPGQHPRPGRIQLHRRAIPTRAAAGTWSSRPTPDSRPDPYRGELVNFTEAPVAIQTTYFGDPAEPGFRDTDQRRWRGNNPKRRTMATSPCPAQPERDQMPSTTPATYRTRTRRLTPLTRPLLRSPISTSSAARPRPAVTRRIRSRHEQHAGLRA